LAPKLASEPIRLAAGALENCTTTVTGVNGLVDLKSDETDPAKAEPASKSVQISVSERFIVSSGTLKASRWPKVKRFVYFELWG
jgi:hypothetical protein